MPQIQNTTVVAAGATGSWVATDGKTNISIGVAGREYRIEYDLGGSLVYAYPGLDADFNQVVVLANANQVRIVNEGNQPVSFEIFS